MQAVKFIDKNQIQSIYIDTLEQAYPSPDCGPKSPNRASKVTTESFLKSVDELMEPFSNAVGV